MVLYPALKRAGIKREPRSYGFHLFRHTAGSIVHDLTSDLKLSQESCLPNLTSRQPRCLCDLKRRCLRVGSVEDQLSFTLLRVNQHVVAEAHLTGRGIQNKFRTSP